MPNVKVTLNKWWLRTGQRGMVGQSYPIDNQSHELTGESKTLEAIAIGEMGDSSSINNPAPDIDNEHPEKMHLRLSRHIGKIERWWTRTRHFWKPVLTPMEQEQLEQVRKNAHIRMVMVRQMMIANKRLPNSYANLGLEYIRNHTKDKYERSKPVRVHFCKWLFSADGNTIYGKIDQVPYGINPAKLVQDDVLTALTVSMGHPCGGRLDPNGGGVVISIALAGTMDIDDMFAFNKALELISESAPPLTYMVGATANGGRKTYNLEEMPHLLIAGATGSGKSVALTSIAATFIARNKPDSVKLLMADLKRMDLVHFEGIPHLVTEIPEMPSGIVIDDKQIIPMLKWLEKQNNQRQAKFSSAKVRSLADWNRHHPSDKLPRIVVLIDELARLMRNSSTSKEFISLTYDLASTARAVGIYLVMATQFAKDKYITTDIKMNIPGRMAFSMPDLPGSICMIETGEAVNIYPPPGRAVFVHGVNRFKFQSPYISPGQIAEIVKNAKEGKTTGAMAKTTELTPEEIVHWSLTENNGFLNARDVFREFTGRMDWDEMAKLLKEMDNKIYAVDDAQYRIVPPASQRARQLERISNDLLPSTPEPQTLTTPEICPNCGATRQNNPCEYCGVM